MWRAKEAKRAELADELDSEKGKKSIFRIAKQMAKDQQDLQGAPCMKDEQAKIVTDSSGVKDIWQRYMEKLLDVENDWDKEVECDSVQGPCCRITEEEVAKALKQMKFRKAAGPTGVVAEMMSAGGQLSTEWLTVLFNRILEEGRIPKDWTKSVLVPLYKGKGDPMSCGSYRAIKLLEQAMKVFERVLEQRVRDQATIDNMQFGFMPGKGTTDAIFIVRQLQEKHLQKKKALYYAFVDLEKAFDGVPRTVIRWALRKSGVEEWLVTAVMTLFKDARTVVRSSAGDSNEFDVKVGLHQGSVLSPVLFTIVMDVISRKARVGLPWELLYADNLVLIATSSQSTTGVFSESGAWPFGVCGKGVAANSILCTACKKWVHRRCSGVIGSLTVASPTFTCRRYRGQTPRQDTADMKGITVDGETYEPVKTFCYLGDTLDAKGGADSAIKARIRSGWRKFRELSPFLTSKAPSHKLKGMVYTACVRTTMIYGSETWAMRSDHEQQLERAEMRMVRWMMRVSLRDKIPSEELRRKLGIVKITDIVRRGRLRWYGHLQRKEDSDWVKGITRLEVPGRRPAGRPSKSWQEGITADIKKLRLTASDTNNRQRWRQAIREATSNPEQSG